MNYINWSALGKMSQKNGYFAQVVAGFNGHESGNAILEGLKKGFPELFCNTPTEKSVPISVLKRHSAELQIKEERAGWYRTQAELPKLGEFRPRTDGFKYNLVLDGICEEYGVPYIEFAIDEWTAETEKLPLIPEKDWSNLKTGDQVAHQEQSYIVVENINGGGSGYCSILSLAPAEAIDMEA